MSKYSLKFQFSPIFFLSVRLQVHQCDKMWDNCNQDNYIYHQYTVNTLKYNIIFFQKKSIVLMKCFMHFFELTNKFNFTWMSFALSTWQGQLPWAAWRSCRTNKCAVCNNSSPIHYNNCPAWAKSFSISTILKNQSRTPPSPPPASTASELFKQNSFSISTILKNQRRFSSYKKKFKSLS